MAAPAFESWEGRVLRGKYRVGPKLGSGGWGAVYEAEHLVLERRVAIKFLHPDVADEPNARERLRREAIAASRTGHPNIIEVIDLDALPDGREFIVLELLDGKALSTILATERALSVRRAHSIFVQIADALSAAHRARVVHRDLKPENVLICPRVGGFEHVKLLDFGIAKVKSVSSQDTFTGTGEVLGTPRYMAPEQVRGDPKLDHRADIHALGLIMYETLAGCGPYDSPDLPTFLSKLMHDTPVPLAIRRSDVSRTLSDLVQRMLAKESSDRPQSAADVCAALTRLAEREPLSEQAPVAPRPTPSPQRPPLSSPDAHTLTMDRAAARGVMKAAPKPSARPTASIRAQSPGIIPPPAPVPAEEPSVVISIELLKDDVPPDDEGPTEAHPFVYVPDSVAVPLTSLRSRPPQKKRTRVRARRTLVRIVRRQRTMARDVTRWRMIALVIACIALGGLSAVITWSIVR